MGPTCYPAGSILRSRYPRLFDPCYPRPSLEPSPLRSLLPAASISATRRFDPLRALVASIPATPAGGGGCGARATRGGEHVGVPGGGEGGMARSGWRNHILSLWKVVLKGSAETPFLMVEVNCHRDVGFQRYACFLSFLEAYNEALCSASLVYRPDASYNISFLSRGDVTESSVAVKRNHGTPPFDSCAKMPLPFTSSTATADVNPTIASRPLIRSDAGPLNEFGAHLERTRRWCGEEAISIQWERVRARYYSFMWSCLVTSALLYSLTRLWCTDRSCDFVKASWTSCIGIWDLIS
uniref:Uncharacterized protein n=1 Tax=Ananas comosus var. bracteatus TaxID=296719 RepID=A0A6V7NEW6_ANACO|nr:unnamed protein product [Ananas comosus var. bracteatus]